MDTRITSEELIRKGFVPESERARLQQYFEAREHFMGAFGPRSDVSDGLQQGLTLLKGIREWSASVPAAIQAHATYLADQVLPLVKHLAEPETGLAIEREVHEFRDMTRNTPPPEPYGPLENWLVDALARNQRLAQRLLDLKTRLESADAKRRR